MNERFFHSQGLNPILGKQKSLNVESQQPIELEIHLFLLKEHGCYCFKKNSLTHTEKKLSAQKNFTSEHPLPDSHKLLTAPVFVWDV